MQCTMISTILYLVVMFYTSESREIPKVNYPQYRDNELRWRPSVDYHQERLFTDRHQPARIASHPEGNPAHHDVNIRPISIQIGRSSGKTGRRIQLQLSRNPTGRRFHVQFGGSPIALRRRVVYRTSRNGSPRRVYINSRVGAHIHLSSGSTSGRKNIFIERINGRQQTGSQYLQTARNNHLDNTFTTDRARQNFRRFDNIQQTGSPRNLDLSVSAPTAGPFIGQTESRGNAQVNSLSGQIIDKSFDNIVVKSLLKDIISNISELRSAEATSTTPETEVDEAP